ncbi:MAG: cob(I)yrinic acid a,c-diamide adenosyltransferase [Candidatus Omnitrophota bacterium]
MLHVYYGKGKGKTSAALGLILRAAGYKKRIYLFQFLKPKDLFSGEHASIQKLPNVRQIRFSQKHPIFMIKDKEKQIGKLRLHVKKSMVKLNNIIKSKRFDVLVCDEMLNLIDCGLIKEDDIVNIFKKIKQKKEIILTGRTKPNKLSRIADYITEFKLIKHPFQKGILARKTVEY